MPMNFPLLLVLLISLHASLAQGQVHQWKFHFRNYGMVQGLPSLETYDAITDHRGFLYISTDRGVVRFDGKRFVPVHFASSTKDYTLFEFTKDGQGRVWCSTYDQGLFYLEDDQLHSYLYNDTIHEIRDGDLVKDYCIGKDGSVYFYLWKFGKAIGRIDPGGRFDYLSSKKFQQSDTMLGLFCDGKIIPFLDNRHINDSFEVIDAPSVRPMQNAIFLPDSFHIQKMRGRYTALGELITVGNVLNVIYPGQKDPVHRSFPQEILCFELVDTSLWVGTRGGLYYFPSLFDMEKYELYFPQLGFNGICPDHQDGLWFTSLQQGVFYLSPHQTRVLDFPAHITDFSIKEDASLTIHTEVRSNSYSAFPREKNVYTFEKTDPITWTQRAGAIAVRKVQSLPGGISALFLVSGFMLYSDKEEAVYFDSREATHFTERVLCVEFFRDTLWIGTANGLYTMAASRIEKWKPEEKGLQIKISDIKACGDETLWIATLGQGLYSYSTGLRSYSEVSVAFIESLYADDSNDIWVGSNAGIYLKAAQNWFHFSVGSGLPSSFIRKIMYKNGEVYGLAGSELFRFTLDKKELKNIEPYTKLHTNLFIDGKKKDWDPEREKIILSQKERHFRLIVDNPNFESSGYTMLYRIAGKDSGWTYADGNSIAFMDMAPGNYTMQVKYTEKITPARAHEFSFNLVKEPQWNQTLWFQLLLVLVGGIITIPPLIWIFKGLLEKRKLHYEKILADQRVLSTQLNPHFTYNALNSMQLLLFGKKLNRALAYNEALGKILRRVFRQSEKTFIPLAYELDLIKEYVALEKLRLHRKFNFTLIAEENIDTATIPIPPLLIQPLIENAIWHGYTEQTQLFEIKCVVKEKSRDLVNISVSDNGKGFEQTPGQNRNSALKNLMQRIELLNSSRLVYIDMKIFSPFRAGGKAGTEIVLTIRYLHEKESDHYRR